MTDREIIREILKDHPGHNIFWDGKRTEGRPLSAKEAMHLQEQYKQEKKERANNE